MVLSLPRSPMSDASGDRLEPPDALLEARLVVAGLTEEGIDRIPGRDGAVDELVGPGAIDAGFDHHPRFFIGAEHRDNIPHRRDLVLRVQPFAAPADAARDVDRRKMALLGERARQA